MELFCISSKIFLIFLEVEPSSHRIKKIQDQIFELEKFFKVTLKNTCYISGNRTLKTPYIFYTKKFSHISGDNLQSSKNKNFLCFSIFQDDQAIK